VACVAPGFSPIVTPHVRRAVPRPCHFPRRPVHAASASRARLAVLGVFPGGARPGPVRLAPSPGGSTAPRAPGGDFDRPRGGAPSGTRAPGPSHAGASHHPPGQGSPSDPHPGDCAPSHSQPQGGTRQADAGGQGAGRGRSP